MAVPCGGSGVSTTCLFLIPSCPSHPRPGHGRRTSWRWGPWNATRWRGPTRAVGSCPRSPSTMSWRPTFRPTTTALPGTASAREQPSSSWKSEVTAALAMSPGHRAAWGLRFLFSPGAWLRDTALFWAHHSLVCVFPGGGGRPGDSELTINQARLLHLMPCRGPLALRCLPLGA